MNPSDLRALHLAAPRSQFGLAQALLKTGALENAIFNSAYFSSIATDPQGVIQLFSQGAQRMLGYAADDVLNKMTPADMVEPTALNARAKALSIELGSAIAPGFEALVCKATRGAEDIYALDYVRKDGSRFAANVSISPLRDAQHCLIGYLFVSTDHTLRKPYDGALRRSEDRYSTLFKSIDEGFCIIEAFGEAANGTLDFRYIEANPAFALQSGLKDVVGKTLRQVLPDEFETWLATYDAVVKTGESIRFERGLTSQGRVLELYAFRVEDDTHRRVGVSFKDITAHKQAQERLRSNHDTFINLVENAPFGLYVVNAEFCLCQVSRASHNAFRQVHPLIGRDFKEVVRTIWPEPFATKVLQHFQHTLDTGLPYAEPNTTEQRKDTPVVESYDWKIERITLPDGQFGVVCYFYDITQRKQIEDALRESEAFNRSIIDSSPDCIKILDLEGNLLSLLNGKELLGIDDVTPLLNTSWLAFWEGEHQQAAQAAVAIAAQGQSANFVGFLYTFHGVGKWWDVAISPILDAQGLPSRLLAVSRDVTARKEAEVAIRMSEARYRSLFNSMDEGFCVIELEFDAHEKPVDWHFLEVNPSFEAHSGLSDAQGKRVRELIPNHDDHWFETYGKVALSGEPIRFVSEAKAMGRWFDLYAFRLGGPESRKVAVLFKNITERIQAENALRNSVRELHATEAQLRDTQAALSAEKAALSAHVLQLQQVNDHLVAATFEAQTLAAEMDQARVQMAHLAQHDALTDLPNRILLNDRMAHTLALAHRQGKQFALMFLDLDRFKAINDTLGHAVGDQLLQSVAKRLTAAVRNSDTVCRLGGDEFVVLLADIEHIGDAIQSAQKILALLAAAHRIDQFALQVTASIGISLYPNNGESIDALIKCADAAMYQAKAAGRNNYHLFVQN